jgi:aryl-alcohol dehydrogenase-like predicted oxidoreductase
MQQRRLGRNGPEVSALGLGCMGMSHLYGPADDAESVATIQAALDAGISYLDTGDFYGMGHNEMVVRRAVAGKRDQAFIAVKFGAMRDPSGAFIGYDARPIAVKNFLAYTLKRLGTDYVDLYQPARVDPAVPIEDTVGAIADLVKAGHVRHLGLSEASAATVKRAHAVHPVAALQIEYALTSRGIEATILPALRELGVSVTAYGVLSRGLLSGRIRDAATLTAGDIRRHYPRFAKDNLAANLRLVAALEAAARDLGATPTQLAFAWVLSRGDDIVPLIGARRRDQLDEALAALDLRLTRDDLRRIEAAVPADAVAGGRYAPAAMAQLDSERPVG